MFNFENIRINVLNCFKRKTFKGCKSGIVGDFAFGDGLVLHIEGDSLGRINKFEVSKNCEIVTLNSDQETELNRLICGLVDDDLLIW